MQNDHIKSSFFVRRENLYKWTEGSQNHTGQIATSA